MSTLQLFIAILVLSHSYQESQAQNTENNYFATTYETTRARFERIVPVQLFDKMYYVTASNNTVILTSIETNGESCRIPFEGDKFRIGYFGRAPQTFENGKILLLSEELSSFLIVDSKNCTLDAFEFSFKTPHNQIENIITYNDTFDVFDNKFEECAPCRFNDKGQQIQPIHKISQDLIKTELNFPEMYHPLSLGYVMNFGNLKEGYILISQTYKLSASIILLNSKFQVLKKRVISHYVRAHSSDFGSFSVCYGPDKCAGSNFEPKCFQITCELLNSKLETMAILNLHNYRQQYGKYYGIYSKINNLPSGDAVALVDFKYASYHNHQSNYDYKVEDIYAEHIHVDGKVDVPVKFNNFINNAVDIHTFVRKNGEYCVMAVYNDVKQELIRTRCTDTLADN